jgi:L-2-hydroxyglutarate oxidase LhgO
VVFIVAVIVIVAGIVGCKLLFVLNQISNHINVLVIGVLTVNCV